MKPPSLKKKKKELHDLGGFETHLLVKFKFKLKFKHKQCTFLKTVALLLNL